MRSTGEAFERTCGFTRYSNPSRFELESTSSALRAELDGVGARGCFIRTNDPFGSKLMIGWRRFLRVMALLFDTTRGISGGEEGGWFEFISGIFNGVWVWFIFEIDKAEENLKVAIVKYIEKKSDEENLGVVFTTSGGYFLALGGAGGNVFIFNWELSALRPFQLQ